MSLKDLILPKPVFGNLDTKEYQRGVRDCLELMTENIKALEASAVKVDTSGEGIWFEQKSYKRGQDVETHSALLICVEPIERAVSKEEIVAALREPTRDVALAAKQYELADRVERFGVK